MNTIEITRSQRDIMKSQLDLLAPHRPARLVTAPVLSTASTPIRVLYSRWGSVRGAESTGMDGVTRHFKSRYGFHGAGFAATFQFTTTMYRESVPIAGA